MMNKRVRNITTKWIRITLISFSVVGAFSGCASQQREQMIRSRSIVQPSANSSAAVSVAPPEYKLGYGDEIEIKVFNQPKFDENLTIRPDGRLTLERVGDIYVTGMTPSSLDSLITSHYAKFIRDPEITVIVRKFGGNEFFVLGQVRNPGGYELKKDTSILQALAFAGGSTKEAKLGSVIVIREGVDQKMYATKVDVSNLLKGSSRSARTNLYLQPKDVVYVPKTLIANMNEFLTQVYAGLLPPVNSYATYLWLTDNK